MEKTVQRKRIFVFNADSFKLEGIIRALRGQSLSSWNLFGKDLFFEVWT